MASICVEGSSAEKEPRFLDHGSFVGASDAGLQVPRRCRAPPPALFTGLFVADQGAEVFQMDTPSGGSRQHFIGTPTASSALQLSPRSPSESCGAGELCSNSTDDIKIQPMSSEPRRAPCSFGLDAQSTRSQSVSAASSGLSTPRWMTGRAAPTQGEVLNAFMHAYERPARNNCFDSDFECGDSDSSDEEL